MPDTPTPADGPSSGATAPNSGATAPSSASSSASPAPSGSPEGDAPTMSVTVPQNDGEIRFFDGAFHRAYQVVNGVVKVALEDVEHFLGHVTGASIKGPNPGP